MKRILVTLMAMSLVQTLHAQDSIKCDGIAEMTLTYASPVMLRILAKNTIESGYGASFGKSTTYVIVKNAAGTIVGSISKTMEILNEKPNRNSPPVVQNIAEVVEVEIDENEVSGQLTASCFTMNQLSNSGNLLVISTTSLTPLDLTIEAGEPTHLEHFEASKGHVQ